MPPTSFWIVAFLLLAAVEAQPQVPGGAFTTATLDSAGDVGSYPSLEIGADRLGLASYYDATNQDLKVVHCSNPACTAATTATLDSTGSVGLFTAIAIGTDGAGLVSYFDATNLDLKVAHCSNPACIAATTATLDSTGNVGRYTSIAIGTDGLGLISYQEADEFMFTTLKVAHCANPTCSTATTATLDTQGSPGFDTSIAIGADGLGLISYHDGWTGELKVAHCSDRTCTTATTTTIDATGNSLLEGTSITIGADGLALISYAARTDGELDLETAHQAPRGDFNLDGRPDILWRHYGTGENMVWLMNGVDLVGSTPTSPPTPADPIWKIVGTNDFNADARTDLLWRHEASGEMVVWFLNGVNIIGGTFTTPGVLADAYWRVVGTGDFNRDGHPDILWRHLVSGQIVVWYMNGSVMTSGTFTNPPAVSDLAWRIAAVGDYNVDARPDILWRHQGSGQIVVWFMDDANLVDGEFTNPSNPSDIGWKVVGPR